MYIKSLKSHQLAVAVLFSCLQLSSAFAQSAIKPEVSKVEKPVELVYQSSFQNYQRYSASPIQSWKLSNETVKEIGGWRAYAKEITQEQNPKPSTPPTHSHGAHQ
ncbi:MAG: hypothetical protein RL420_172 [Pseudomonadota bacterium]|jgi:hypothetical protein